MKKFYKEEMNLEEMESNERGEINYRKLFYYYSNQVFVHFKDKDDIFYNGLILELNEEKLIMVLRERIKGVIPFILEDIQTESIAPYTTKEERENGTA